jgi:DNA-binding PadR family transcriptional regulator
VSLIFQSFKRRGWVDCQHEATNTCNHKPPRVLYSLTANGVVAIRDALIPFQHAPVST